MEVATRDMGHGAWESPKTVADEIKSFRDLEVYQMLCDLHLDVCNLSYKFPSFEKFELGSQLRISSNSILANMAEVSGNKHLTVYLEALSRALGEPRETLHHLYIAFKKGLCD
jgi:four helix bundle protein